MAKFAGDARACMLTTSDPAAAMMHANHAFCNTGIEERFITLSLGTLDPNLRKLSYASAGHLPIMIRRRDGTIEEFGPDVSGFPLGIDSDCAYGQGAVTLEPGDVALVYTDGVLDARNPADEAYDTEANHRLRKRVETAGGTPTDIGRAILQDLREFSSGHPQFDDMTVVCFGPLED
jgi:serine phosphatase RsbU (regulator of sigma subunit)